MWCHLLLSWAIGLLVMRQGCQVDPWIHAEATLVLLFVHDWIPICLECNQCHTVRSICQPKTVIALLAPSAKFDTRNFASLSNKLLSQTYSVWRWSFYYSTLLVISLLRPSSIGWSLHRWLMSWVMALKLYSVLLQTSLYHLVMLMNYLIVMDLVMKRAHFESSTERKIFDNYFWKIQHQRKMNTHHFFFLFYVWSNQIM